MPRLVTIIFSSILMLTLIACGSEGTSDPFANCKYSQPAPIFKGPNTGIVSHSFKLEGTQGIEEVQFSNGMNLTLVQSGCDFIRQDFQFRLNGNLRNKEEAFWIQKAVESFQFLGSLGPQFLAFNAWGQAIENIKGEIRLGAYTELQPEYFIKLDRVLSSDHAILMLTLTEKP
ncbi:MAG: hypothetical protein MRY78_12705 [Saprospiraceae bacterium]|nr:hypothetical protein [Saprospiraceae bacterium]